MTLANRIRAIPADVPPRRVAEELACCPRYVSTVRWKDANPRKVAQQRVRRMQRRPQALIALQPGDPRRAAWLQHYRLTGAGELAQRIERMRLPVEAPRPWPPESAEVEVIGAEIGGTGFRVPWGTPEWAAHVAAERRDGKRGQHRAAAMESSKETLTVRRRWPVIEGERD